MVKAWCTDLAQEIASMGIQVHGGVGFIEETGVAQHLRDARILPIYEGTNGIQAMDLVGRKLDLAGGELPWRLLRGAARRAADACRPNSCRRSQPPWPRSSGPPATCRPARRTIARRARSPISACSPTTLGGFLLARGAAAAATAADWPALARFYVTSLLPPALALESPGHGRRRQSRRSPARRLILRRAAYAADSASGSGGSTAPVLWSWRATVQHSSAQQAPRVQPASTSVGQCTPR